MSNEHEFTMKIGLNVLRHLGIGLYSNVPAVVAEIIANSWDADATRVDITIDAENGRILIRDNGDGMTKDDINAKYLFVGYQRREHEPIITKLGRSVMGRKGIGKLSVFSIAAQIDIYTAKDGVKTAFRMATSDIEKLIRDKNDEEYHPAPLDSSEIDFDKGTEIRLTHLDKTIATLETFLRRRVARRFSIIGHEHNFNVYINEEEISPKDRDYFRFVEFIWYLGEESRKYSEWCVNALKDKSMPNVVSEKNNYVVTGWIGTVDEQKNIDEHDNSIVIFARGRLVLENLIPYLKEGGLYTKYLMGEIDADFLDLEGTEDLTTTDRQRLKEDNERFKALKRYVQETVLQAIENDWTKFRREKSAEKAFEIPAVEEWYRTLGGDNKKYARQLFEKIERFRFDDVTARRELYRSSILAFEKLKLKDDLSVLDDLQPDSNLQAVLKLFGSIDEIEATEYYGIVKSRIEVLVKFVGLTPEAQERVIQEFIFNHLWLLDPSWERASTNPHMEEAVTTEFNKINAKLTKQEKAGRIDIRYKTAANKHIIIELKKYNRSVQAHELVGQVRKYRTALEKCLKAQYPGEPHHVEIICILGKPLRPEDRPQENEAILRAINARVMTYDQLIRQSTDSYKDYLEKQKRVSKLAEIVSRI